MDVCIKYYETGDLRIEYDTNSCERVNDDPVQDCSSGRVASLSDAYCDINKADLK
jgi:hypothetical protein